MSYDRGLAQRIREQLQDRTDIDEKHMFGGLCFMVSKYMCCGIVGNTLMARVGADNYEQCLTGQYVREMDFTGRAMKGFVYVSPEAIESDTDLATWVSICITFVESLPVKKPQ